MVFSMQNNLATKAIAGWNFDNSYVRLPEIFYARLNPVPVCEPRMAAFNHTLAESLGLNKEMLQGGEGASIFAGNHLPEGSEPIAQAYAGHQFGYFTMLGDGRAILLGEHIAPNGKRFDLQLKGSGQTPFSRRGDGRAALGPMLREYIISEAMHALGIPTTRSLAVVTTGETVYRETALPGAILTRVAASHIRVGTFQYIAAQDDIEGIRTLADYTLNRHYPDLAESDNPYLALLQAVLEQQASLVAKWQLVGFIHGVMNTDNMALSGQTIDYGPCAFMDTYDPTTVFSSIDTQGRYAYGNQPIIAQWNLARLTETLLPLLHSDQEKSLALGQETIATFPVRFQHYWLSGMRTKLGLFNQESEDLSLIEHLLNWMHQHQADYTNTFRALSSATLQEESFSVETGFTDWYLQWQARLARQPETLEAVQKLMRSHSPAVIPRNHRVEEALSAATEDGDFSVMQRLLVALESPYDESSQNKDYRLPPSPSSVAYQTFCGT
jgi:serine/tyrosine/threonine adenylyltransferase